MDFFKKIGKEVSVFGLVFVVLIALFAYRQATHVELSTISQDKLEEKIKDKDSFVVVVGSDKDNTTLIPSTFVMKNGKVKVQKSGSLSYYRIAELFK